MKILKWIAATVLLVGLSALLGLILFGFSQRYRETSELIAADELTAAKSVPESIMDLPLHDIRPGSYYTSARLLDATLIDGFPCAAGDVRFFTRSGRLSGCVIAEDAVIGGNLIPQNTKVELYAESTYWRYFFPENTNIQGISCTGGKVGLTRSTDIPTALYPSGRLRGCYSSSNVTIQEIPCRKTNFGLLTSTPLYIETPIFLHENGSVRSCTLSRDAEIDGQSIPARSEIVISEDGEVKIVDASWKRRTGLWFDGIFGH